MIRIAAVLLATLLATAAIAQINKDGSVARSLLPKFGDAIRAVGYNCKRAEFGQAAGQDHAGTVYRIRCSGYVAYRVTIADSGRIVIKPW